MDRRAWHRKASRPVSLWLAGLFVLAFVHRWVPQSRWLLVHMFTLGMITNSILVWGQHFADALLRTRTPDESRHRQVWRIRLLNLGIVVTCLGMLGRDGWRVGDSHPGPWVAVLGATIVGATLCWYALGLLGQVRRSLPARFTSTVKFYAAAALLLPVGATFGGFMAFSQPEPWQGRLLLAHLLTNIGGFVGLTAVGTLVTLWPTVLRTKMQPGQDVAGLRALVLMSGGVGLGIAGALLGMRPVVALALAAYLAGLVVIGLPLVRCAMAKPPRDFPSFSIGAGLLWFVGSLTAVLVRLLHGRDLVAADLQQFSVPLVAGFGVQLLFGAMSYLMPTVMGGGPSVVRATTGVMNRLGALRVTLYNAALLVFLTTTDSWVRVLTSLLAFAVLAAFIPLLRAMVKTSVAERRRLADEGPSPAPEAGDPTRRDLFEAGLGIAAVWGATKLGRHLTTGGGASDEGSRVAATGRTSTVQVKATAAMRFEPDTIDVPPGDRLVIELTNADPAMVHDLYLANGATTGRVEPGASATLDAGVIDAPIEGWCSIVGHRAMGMVFHITVAGAAASSSGHDHTAQTAEVDLTQPPGDGFTTRDAVVPKPVGGTLHLDLVAEEVEQEVAPGTTQTAMTYNGRVMGPVIVGTLGQRVEATLTNKGTMGHSIDFHAGDVRPDEVMRTIAPGEKLDYRFEARRSGIWLYHCATMPMSSHLAAGMYGAFIVPPKGLAKADREYVLVQQEMYLGADGHVDADKIAAEEPDLVVWNGHANQYVFDPLTAKVGERVRLWVLAAGPSRGTSFHVVGGQFDTVFKEGAYLLRPGNAEGGGAQAIDLGPCQGGFVEMVFREPGRYVFVNHSFVEAERGARGFIDVS